MNQFSKVVCKSLSATVLTASLLGIAQSKAQAEVLGDNYPSHWKNAAPDTITDSWTMWNRECTSFVAFRLSSANGYTLPFGYGYANTWGSTARSRGVRVDNIPAVGSIAWFDSYTGGAGEMGHVAWVANVFGNQVEIEEYNYDAGQGSHRYYRRTLDKSKISGFIHFKDLGSPSTPNKQVGGGSSLTPISSSSDLPSKGLYRFTQSAPVKAAASMSSAQVATYDVGQSVNYDSKLEADGYVWISYIGGSGARRYVPIKKLATTPTTTPTIQPVTYKPAPAPNPNSSKSQTINVGDTITFKGVFRVHAIHGSLLTSSDLAGGTPNNNHLLDPGPVTKTNASGVETSNQLLYPGDYFIIPGKYKVLRVDRPTNGLYLQIGNRSLWVTAEKVTKV